MCRPSLHTVDGWNRRNSRFLRPRTSFFFLFTVKGAVGNFWVRDSESAWRPKLACTLMNRWWAIDTTAARPNTNDDLLNAASFPSSSTKSCRFGSMSSPAHLLLDSLPLFSGHWCFIRFFLGRNGHLQLDAHRRTCCFELWAATWLTALQPIRECGETKILSLI